MTGKFKFWKQRGREFFSLRVCVYVWMHVCVCVKMVMGKNDEITLEYSNISLLLFSHSVMPDSFQPQGLQHTRLPCPSPSPGACSNSCLSSWWCHPNISSSVIPFSPCLQSFPASDLFQWVSSSHDVAKVLEFQLSIRFLPGESHAQSSLVGCSSWGHKELDMTEVT